MIFCRGNGIYLYFRGNVLQRSNEFGRSERMFDDDDDDDDARRDALRAQTTFGSILDLM